MKKIDITIDKRDWPVVFEDNALSLRFKGEIYSTCGDKESVSSLANTYKMQGPRALCGLNGHYLIAVNDKVGDEFYLINDRYGFKRCYYRLDSGNLIFSTDYKDVCSDSCVRGRVDKQSIADFLYLGFVLDERTLHQDVKLLPAASILSYKNNQVSIEKYWDYSFSGHDCSCVNEEEYLEELTRRIRVSLKRRLAGKSGVIVPISGGLDSRTIAGMMSKYGYEGRVESFSYGNRSSYDVVYGKEIAKALGYKHTFLPINTDYLARYAEKFVALTDGTIDCLNSHMMLFHDIYPGNQSLNVLSGFLGDVLTGTNFNRRWLNFDEDQIILKTFEIPDNHLESLKYYLNKDIYERTIENTIPSIKRHFNRTGHDDLFYKAHYLTLSQRQRRYVAFNIFCCESLGNVLSPFTDNDVIDFTLQMPREYLMEQSLYRKMFVKYLPEIASIPWSKSRLPLNASRIKQGLHWRWQRLNKNPLIKATIGRSYSRMKDSYLNTDEAIRAGSKDFVVSHIMNNPFIAEYFNIDRVHHMLDSHMSKTGNEYRKIMALLTLSLWHKLFI